MSRHDSSGARPIPAAAGVGLRLPHHASLIELRPPIPWLEVHPENYMTGGEQLTELDLIAQTYPLSLHAVGLSLGSSDRPDREHLEQLRELVQRFEPGLVSDHLSWSAVGNTHLPDLLPLPYTEEALRVVTRNVDFVQSVLRRQILLENPSKYLDLPQSALSEPEFLAAVVRRTGCGVLLDVNNVFVSAANRGDDPDAVLGEFLEQLTPSSIGEIHLAGHATIACVAGVQLRVDDHGSRVSPAVWSLFRTAIRVLGPRPTLIEWDTRLPAFEVLQDEAGIAQAVLAEAAQSVPAEAPATEQALALAV